MSDPVDFGGLYEAAYLEVQKARAAWPYGGCELSSDVPCNPFDCCEICQVPGAGKHANPSAQTTNGGMK